MEEKEVLLSALKATSDNIMEEFSKGKEGGDGEVSEKVRERRVEREEGRREGMGTQKPCW